MPGRSCSTTSLLQAKAKPTWLRGAAPTDARRWAPCGPIPAARTLAIRRARLATQTLAACAQDLDVSTSGRARERPRDPPVAGGHQPDLRGPLPPLPRPRGGASAALARRLPRGPGAFALARQTRAGASLARLAGGSRRAWRSLLSPSRERTHRLGDPRRSHPLDRRDSHARGPRSSATCGAFCRICWRCPLASSG